MDLKESKCGDIPCLENVLSYLDKAHVDPGVKVKDAAKALHMSERTLRRKCQLIFNMTPIYFITHYRIDVAKHLLRQGDPVSNVAIDVGFTTHSHFSTQFKKLTGLTPQEYQQKNLTIE